MDEYVRTILNGKGLKGAFTINDRDQLVVRSMCKTIDAIMNYNYADIHYAGDDTSSVMKDKLASVKSNLAVLLSDVELYMQALDIADDTRTKAYKRIVKMAERVKEREENENGN